MVRCFIFDVDGTLIDSDDAVFMLFNDILQRFGFKKRKRDEIMRYRGNTTENWLKKLLPEIDEHEIKMMTLYGQKRFANWFLPRYGRPKGKVKQTLKKLKERGIKLAVITNQVKKELEKSLDILDFYDFDAVITSENVINPKPNPEAVFLIMKKLDLMPDEIIFVGDSKIDYETAKNAGVKVILFENEQNKVINCKKIQKIEDLIGVVGES